MLAAILAALQAIPVMASAIRDLVSAINKNTDRKWFEDEKQVFIKLDKPTTPEEKAALAKKLADLTAS